MIEQTFEETKAVYPNTLLCDNCNEEVMVCGCLTCDKYFEDGDTIYCGEDGYHICKQCYDNMMEAECEGEDD